jgi:hypothetical protein
VQTKENAVEKSKRSYFLPTKLVSVFDKECRKSGYVRERVVAAAIANFLNASPDGRHKMFLELDHLLNSRRAK